MVLSSMGGQLGGSGGGFESTQPAATEDNVTDRSQCLTDRSGSRRPRAVP